MNGPAKIRSDPKHALGLVQYLRAIGYEAWVVEDINGKVIEETVLKYAKGDVSAH